MLPTHNSCKKHSCGLRCTKLCCPLRYVAPITSMSNTEFILAHHHKHFSGLAKGKCMQHHHAACCNDKSGAYNNDCIPVSEWNKINIQYPDNFTLGVHSITFDAKSNKVYICTETQLLCIDMTNYLCTILCTFDLEKVGQIFCIDDVVHIINFRMHYSFNLKTSTKLKQIEQISDFAEENELFLDPGSLCFLQQKQVIIGRSFKVLCHKSQHHTLNNSISEYSLVTNTWTHYNEWIPFGLIGGIGVSVCTRNEDYIFSIGGQRHLDLAQNEVVDFERILIFDVQQNEFEITNDALCTSKELSFITMTRNNEDRDEMLLFGFIDGFWRNEYGQSNGYNHSFPSYLIKYIREMICFEVIHIIGYNEDKSGTEHWEISVDDVLKSKSKLKEVCLNIKEDEVALKEKADEIMQILINYSKENKLFDCKKLELLALLQDNGFDEMTLPRLERILNVLADDNKVRCHDASVLLLC